jgi:large subunit ribosomal protein L6
MTTEAVVAKQSRLGKIPVALPKGVTVALTADKAEVKGPKGALSLKLPESVTVSKEGDALVVSSNAAPKDAPRLQGLGRALLANVVKGCAEGYQRALELVGVGYRAEVKGQDLHLALGLSHPVVFRIPTGVTVDIPKESKGTIINLASADKALIGQVSATIRGFRPPEPYGGKGVRYRGENVRRKAGKSGKK